MGFARGWVIVEGVYQWNEPRHDAPGSGIYLASTIRPWQAVFKRAAAVFQDVFRYVAEVDEEVATRVIGFVNEGIEHPKL